MSVIDSARRTIRRYGLLPSGSRVVVALSGGPDSVALLVVMRELAATDGFHLVGAAHLNHRLRGNAADADEAFCQQLATELSTPLHVEQIDVASLARERGVSLEHAAHDARQEFFARAVTPLEADMVAVAHTKNDQAETFLLRLLRGAGPRGLSGMHPRSGIVIRPFIETARCEIREFLEQRGMSFREDATNDDWTIPRNHIRHELLPFLETRFSPAVVDVLAREAAIAREDADYLESAAEAAAERLLSRRGDDLQVAIDGLLSEPPAVARRVIRRAQQIAAGGRFLGFDAVDALLFFAVSNSTGPIDLPGHRVNRRGNMLVISSSRGRPAQSDALEFSYELEIPGQVSVPEAACAISADIRSVPSGRSAADLWVLSGRSDEVVVEAGQLAKPLEVRNRRPGDKFRPLGLRGHKKLQDLFVDAKVQRSERDTTPVVVDSSGQIVWVAGHALSEEFRVTDRTRAVVILKRKPI